MSDKVWSERRVGDWFPFCAKDSQNNVLMKISSGIVEFKVFVKWLDYKLTKKRFLRKKSRNSSSLSTLESNIAREPNNESDVVTTL